jgi:hypothetical protein
MPKAVQLIGYNWCPQYGQRVGIEPTQGMSEPHHMHVVDNPKVNNFLFTCMNIVFCAPLTI